ncbi:MAG: UDP-2,3-diacylglucosamine diphosphatase LpxI [Planctomycetota bacterium]
MTKPIGIIAGGGRLPVLMAQGVRAAGRPVAGLGMAGQYDEAFPDLCDSFTKVGVLRLGEWSRKLRRAGAEQAVMVGLVDKAKLMYMPWYAKAAVMRPDREVIWLWYRVLRHDRRSQTLLAAVADALQRRRIELIDTTRYIPDHLAEAGVMTQRGLSAAQKADVAFGWPILMQMNDLEIGQSIAVRGRDVVAVEAVEGTDAMIKRSGELARGQGWTLLKGAGATKDLRFDVPTVGIKTIEGLQAAGAVCLAVDAGRVIFVDKPAVLAAADRAGIAVVGVDDAFLAGVASGSGVA